MRPSHLFQDATSIRSSPGACLCLAHLGQAEYRRSQDNRPNEDLAKQIYCGTAVIGGPRNPFRGNSEFSMYYQISLGLTRTVQVHSKFHRKLQSRGIHVSIKKEFNAKDVFVGASVSLKVTIYTMPFTFTRILSSGQNPNDVEDLRKTPGVLAVHPVTIIPRPE